MAFNINGSTPPAYARPSAPFTKGVIHPKHTRMNGNGQPVGAVGPIIAEVGRRTISAAGHAWWMAYFSTETDLYVAVTNVTIYDPLYEAERTFSTADMLRPVWSDDESNLGLWYKNYIVTFTNLVA